MSLLYPVPVSVALFVFCSVLRLWLSFVQHSSEVSLSTEFIILYSCIHHVRVDVGHVFRARFVALSTNHFACWLLWVLHVRACAYVRVGVEPTTLHLLAMH